ncbi:unnamed protein product [Cylindrotheca closterium]|uniref:Subtilisin n=1 Tax=Cylindrotheca closterium TaxID=2856 RepID=A0AAD2JLZ9_9STRA|nr:unnamed protein product [Cylindrotheca closterium]
MRKASSALALLLLSLCQSAIAAAVSSDGMYNAANQMFIVEEVENLAMMNQHHQERRLNVVVVNECLDATDYFAWDSTNAGENLLRLYYECTCSGDFGSEFSMICVLDNHCFVGGNGGGGDEDVISTAQNTNLTFPTTEQCVTRSFTYDFTVDTFTGAISDISRFGSSDVFESGFGFTGNFTNVNYNPCRIALQLEYDYTIQDAIATCNNRTTCEAFFNENTTRTPLEIDYICPTVLYNDVECQAFNLLACADFDETTQTRYVAMPDCSNVNPCLTTSCQAYPRIDTAPERFLFRYPECEKNEDADDDDNEPTNSTTTSPSLAPTIMVTPGDNDSISPTLEPTAFDLCSHAVDYLGTTQSLKENYDCSCSGGSDSNLVMDCTIQEYCFLDKQSASLEYCVNHNLTFTFTLDDNNVTNGDILDITRAESCTDFLQNGPTGRLCRNDWSICRLALYDVLEDMDGVLEICLDRPTCIGSVQDLLNYTLAEAEYLCPSVTLDGQECNSVGYGDCGEQDFVNNLFFRNMPDCSNIESCATSTCQTAVIRDPTPQRFMETYPQCGLPNSGGGSGGGDGDETPTNSPTISPGDVAPGDTISASAAVTRARVDYALAFTILLGAVAASMFSQW